MYPPGREILLGVTGGISAYKSCDLLRRLRDEGFLVTVVPTRASLNFVGVATWEALSGRQVPVDIWNNVYQVPHISLSKTADAIVIAPATADIIAKCAAGIADDLLTNVVLASRAHADSDHHDHAVGDGPNEFAASRRVRGGGVQEGLRRNATGRPPPEKRNGSGDFDRRHLGNGIHRPGATVVNADGDHSRETAD